MRVATVAFGLLATLVLATETTRPAGGGAAAGPEPSHETGLPFFDVYAPGDYRGHFQVWCAAQDAAGLTYFGNFGRVLVHDGARWEHLEVPGTSYVRGLAVDDRDVLWIAAANELGYAAPDPTGRRTFVSLRDKLPPEAREFGELTRVVLTPRGPVFHSGRRLLRWDGTAFATLALPSPQTWQLAAAGESLWVTNDQGSWHTVADDGRTLTLVPRECPAVGRDSALNFALPGNAPGEFIFGSTRAGLLRWDGREFTPFPTAIDGILKQKRLYRGARLADGRLALTTLQAGAYLLAADGRLLAALDEDARMPDNTAIAPFATREGGLWIGLHYGLVHVDARPWLTWFGPASGAPRTVLQPPVRFRGELYTCGESGLMRLVPATGAAPAKLVPVPQVRDFLNGLAVADDALIGLGSSGIFEWQGGEARPLPGRPLNAFDLVAATGQPGRWFAVLSDGLQSYRKEAGQWVFEGPVPELTGVRSAVAEPDGTWWMGTPSDGVLRVKFPQASATGPGLPVITRYTAGHGLPAGHGWTRFSLDERGALLRCDRGYFRFDAASGSFRSTAEFGARFADGSTAIRAMVQGDRRDGMWIATAPAGEAQLMTSVEFGVAGPAGWRALNLPQLSRLDYVSGLEYEAQDDALWLSVHGGLIRLDLARWRSDPAVAEPRVVLRGVETAGGARLPVAGGWRLPYAQRSLHVSFAAPALTGDSAGVYESTLLGGGDPVVLADGTPVREFSALGSGDYTLRLRARRGSGQWSAPVEFAFTVLPPWWRSGWAWAAYGALGAGAVVAFVRWRTRALHRRAEQLEATVAARTEDLRRSNVELARLNRLELDEKIAARLAEEKARLELLRYQLNPHFLLNAFTTLRDLVFSRPASAGEMVAKLAEFCRLALTRTDESGGTVADEAKLIEVYLDTEKSRWRDELACSLESDPAVAAVRLPPFLLQPLVENAVKYGGRTTPDRLEVRVRIAGDGASGLRIEVANTGAWVGADSPHRQGSTGLGLDNLRQRLRRYYPDAHDLDVQSAEGWVRVVLYLRQPARDPFAPTHFVN